MWRRWVGRQPTGIDRVCLAYLEHFGPGAQAVIQHRRIRKILDRHSSSALFDLLRQPNRQFRAGLLRAGFRFSAKKGGRGRGRIYLNVGHTGLNNAGFRAWVRRFDVRPIYFVHDLIPIMHPEFCRPGERDKHIERMRSVLDTAAGVITNSKATLDDLSALAKSENKPAPRGIAALLGSDALPPLVSAHEPERPTFVILGTIEARKNHLMLLHVWSRIVQQLGDRAPRLLVIGERGWECEQVFDLLDRSWILREAVTEINRCDDPTLSAYLRQARALLFPSLVEGYGLPLVEALRCNTPVIASDLPVFREIAGDVPDYLDPLDGPGWQRAILSYSNDKSANRSSQIRRIGRYQPPTWHDHFAVVDSWLTTL